MIHVYIVLYKPASVLFYFMLHTNIIILVVRVAAGGVFAVFLTGEW